MDLAAFGDLSEDQDKYKYNYTKQGYKKMLQGYYLFFAALKPAMYAAALPAGLFIPLFLYSAVIDFNVGVATFFFRAFMLHV